MEPPRCSGSMCFTVLTLLSGLVRPTDQETVITEKEVCYPQVPRGGGLQIMQDAGKCQEDHSGGRGSKGKIHGQEPVSRFLREGMWEAG